MLAQLAEELRKGRIPISVVLSLSLTGLMVFTVFLLLRVGVGGLRAADIAEFKSDSTAKAKSLAQHAKSIVDPVKAQGESLAAYISETGMDAKGEEALFGIMHHTMNAVDQMAALGVIWDQNNFLWVFRGLDEKVQLDEKHRADLLKVVPTEWAKNPTITASDPIFVEEMGVVLPYAFPIGEIDDPSGYVIAALKLDSLADWLTGANQQIAPTAFLLYGREYALAHPNLSQLNFQPKPNNPLAKVGDLGDKTIRSLWLDTSDTLPPDLEITNAPNEPLPLHARAVESPNGRIVVYMAELTGYGRAPWLVGAYSPLPSAAADRIGWAVLTLIVMCLVALAITLALLLSRALSRPIEQLGRAAASIGEMDFEQAGLTKRSRLTEIDDAADAFNKMAQGLNWFQSYVPSTLVRRLMRLGNADELQSEYKDVTIMFTDLSGFSSLSETLGAQETVQLLNEHFELIGQCIDQESGTIDKYTGDGLMAFWGAPESQPHHADQALRAARAIQSALGAVNRKRWDAGAEPFRVRIGLHTGRVSVGNVGAPGRINYTVIGDSVNMAQRIESLGREFMQDDEDVIVLASEQTIQAAGFMMPNGEIKISGADVQALGGKTFDSRTDEIKVFRIR
jgi:adenylate cyclase